MHNIFFSHSSDDEQIVRDMVAIVEGGADPVTSFYSSDPKTGVLAGEGIMARINKEIVQCQLFVPVITENYVRSQYCMYELSVAAFLQEQGKLRIIPIVSSQAIYDRVSSILTQFDLLYIDAGISKAAQIFFQTFPWVSESALTRTEQMLQKLSAQTVSTRPYIGMSSNSYANILEYCQKYGIKQIKDTTLPSATIKEKISHAKEVILLSTTGASLIKSLCADALPAALSRGCKVSVLIPNQHSDFCKDVAQIERPDATEENAARLAQEYAAVMVYLKDAIAAAGENNGSVTCYCSHNLLRQTILLALGEDNTVWSWVSLTMPPKRTIDGTPSFEVEGKLEPGHMAHILWQHCQSIMTVSRQRGTFFDMESGAKGPFYLEKDHAKEYWYAKYNAAAANMERRKDQYDCALIEVAAQHPLKRRKLPGEEFKNRLDTAIQIHKKLGQQGIDSYFYVPGSRHRFNGVDDLVSLSAAGKEYLLSKGIDEDLILGEEMNEKYKGADGVYNSADECCVASKIFAEGEFDRLICICSPNQILRKTLFYIEFGVLPQCYGVPAEHLYHNPLDEIFNSLQTVIYKDHSWQDPRSDSFRFSRRSRMPQDD